MLYVYTYVITYTVHTIYTIRTLRTMQPMHTWYTVYPVSTVLVCNECDVYSVHTVWVVCRACIVYNVHHVLNVRNPYIPYSWCNESYVNREWHWALVWALLVYVLVWFGLDPWFWLCGFWSRSAIVRGSLGKSLYDFRCICALVVIWSQLIFEMGGGKGSGMA